MKRSALRALLVLAAVCGLSGLVAGPASAHVTVVAPGVGVGGSDGQITFRAPDESDTASTVGLAVQLPLNHPLLGVLTAPMPGWTAKMTQAKLPKPVTTDDGTITEATSKIVWTVRKGAGIKPGQFGDFTIIVGTLPDRVSSLTFPTIQTYSDGKQVKWIEVAAPGSTAEPQFPAPVLQLAAQAATGSSSDPAQAASDSVSTTGPTVLAVVALVVAVGALAVAVLGLARGRRT